MGCLEEWRRLISSLFIFFGTHQSRDLDTILVSIPLGFEVLWTANSGTGLRFFQSK